MGYRYNIMLISELEALLKREREFVGDVQVTMQATLLPDGYSRTGSDIEKLSDVFESTIEQGMIIEKDDDLGKRLQLFWQC